MRWLPDVIVAVIAVVSVFIGYRRGFLRTLLQLVGCLAAFLLAFWLCRPVAEWTFDRFVASKATESVTESLNNAMDENLTEKTESLLKSLPSPVAALLKNNTELKAQLSDLNGKTEAAAARVAEQVVGRVIRPLAVTALRFVYFLILFVVLWLAIRLLSRLLKPITRSKLLKPIDGPLGAVLGLARGALWVLLAVTVMQLIALSNPQAGPFTKEALEDSVIVSRIVEISPVAAVLE